MMIPLNYQTCLNRKKNMTYIIIPSPVQKKQYKAFAFEPNTSDVFSYQSSYKFRASDSANASFFNPTNITNYTDGEVVHDSLSFDLDLTDSLPDGLYHVKYELSVKSSLYSTLEFSSGKTNRLNGFINSWRSSSPYNCFNRHFSLDYNGFNNTRRSMPSNYSVGSFIYDHHQIQHVDTTNLTVEFTCATGLFSNVPHNVLPNLCFELNDGQGNYLTSTSQFDIVYYALTLTEFDEDNDESLRQFS